jgi:hypothetical protein
MPYFDANACMDAFCKLCEAAVLSELISAEECQYWVFEHGYRSANASMATFSKLCEQADASDLLSAIDCQYWLFERGYLAAKFVLTDLIQVAEVKKPSAVAPSSVATKLYLQ